MSQVSSLIVSLENKIKLIEQNIAQAASQTEQWVKNHAGLTGMLQATKEALVEAMKVADFVAPESSVTEALNVVENVVNVIDNLEETAPNAN